MNLEELQTERAKVVREIEEKTIELKADLAAIDRLILRVGGKAPAEPSRRIFVRKTASQASGSILPSLLARVNLAAMVRTAIGAMNAEPFSLTNIIDWLAKHHPLVEAKPPTISAQLWHMQNKGQLFTVQERNGNKPALYKATETFRAVA